MNVMKATEWIRSDVSLRLVLLASVGVAGVSCSLPPREAWQRIREEGVLKAFFVPKRSGVTDDRTQRLAGADLSDDDSGSRSLPVAEPAAQAGYVYSPRTATRKLVNVKDFAAGDTVLCPYTLEPFVVPGAGASSGLAGEAVGGRELTPMTPTHAAPPRLASTRPTSQASESSNPAVQELPLDASEGADASSASAPVPAPQPETPYGTWVAAKPGHVYSPYAQRHQLVDVTGIAPATEVHCPFTDKIFRVPELESAPTSLAQSLPEPEPAAAGSTTLTSDTFAGSPLPVETIPTKGEAPDLRSLAGVETPADSTGSPLNPTPPTEAPSTAQSNDPNLSSAGKSGAPVPPTAASSNPGAPKYGATTPATPAAASTPSAPLTADGQTSASKSPDKPSPQPKKSPALPTATWVPGKSGLVQSPYGKPGELVDVTGKPSGSKVVCPYTNKPFIVPKP